MPGHIIGFMSNDHRLAPLAIAEVAGELDVDTSLLSGVGVGWLQGGRALERKSPRVGDRVHDPLALIADTPSREIVAHLEAQPSSGEPMQPHRFREWLYAEGACFPLVDEEVPGSWLALPDFLERHAILGAPASVRFLRVLREVFDEQAFHGASTHRERAARAIAAGVRRLNQESGGFERYSAIWATRRMMTAVSQGRQLYWRRWAGITQPAPRALFAGHRTRPVAHEHYRAWVVTDIEPTTPSQWETLPAGHVVYMGGDWEVSSFEL